MRYTPTYDALDALLRRQMSRHFGVDVQLSPTARNALMCDTERDGMATHSPDKWSGFHDPQVFERLVTSAPAFFTPLDRADVDIDRIDRWPTWKSPGYPTPRLVAGLFPRGGDLWRVVREAAYVNEYVLFRALVLKALAHPWSYVGKSLSQAWRPSQRRDAAAVELGFALRASLAFMDPPEVDATSDLATFELLLDLDDREHIRVSLIGRSGTIQLDATEGVYDAAFPIHPESLSRSGVSAESLAEYEALINDLAPEGAFQLFFEQYPGFLLCLGNYADLRSHVALVDDGGERWIPDFMLVPRTSPYVDLVELKRPDTPITASRAGRRRRFSASIHEAAAQLRDYQRFFDDRENRLEFAKQIGLRACLPRMILVAGTGELSAAHRASVGADVPDGLELITYDAIARRASKYAALSPRTRSVG